MSEVLFWLGVAVAVYPWAGYPVALYLLRLVRHPAVRRAPHLPSISVLVPAYNEESVLRDKLGMLLACDYPADKLEIAVASDGSRDRTAEIAREFSAQGVKVFDYKENRGKTEALNETVPQLRGELLVLSDASVKMRPNAIRLLAENFADPQVGAAGGIFLVAEPDEAEIGRSEDLYWRFETMLKQWESDCSSTLGMHGALYAIRRGLYTPMPRGTINDDFIIPLRVIQKGFRAVYDRRAVCWDEAREMSGFGRRVRIMTGNLQMAGELLLLLRPPRWQALFFLLSRKMIRMCVPYGMLLALLANLFLLDQPVYQALGVGQGIFYGLALLGGVWPLQPKLLRLPYFFVLVNAAMFVATYNTVTGRKLRWK